MSGLPNWISLFRISFFSPFISLRSVYFLFTRTLTFISAVLNVRWTHQICWGDNSDECYKSVWMNGIWLISDTFPSYGWSERVRSLFSVESLASLQNISPAVVSRRGQIYFLLSTGGPWGKADLFASVTISTVVCRLWALSRALHSIWLCKSRAVLVHYRLTHC